MHDNPHAAENPVFHLADHQLMAVCGRDAIAFAQSQFMNDVAALQDRQWQWNGWLNAKGRVRALFALLRLDPQTLWLLLPDTHADTLLQALRRYVFRSKLSLEVLPLTITGQVATPAHASGNQLAKLDDGSIEMDMGGNAGQRRLRIDQPIAPSNDNMLAQWAVLDLIHGLPRLPASQAEQWTPQQLSLDRLAAFSVKKGCYPGQEIVARTHFLGQAKRGLVLLEAQTPLQTGSDVTAEGRSIGSTIACAGTLALAVLPVDHVDTLSVAGTPVHVRVLADGLAR